MDIKISKNPKSPWMDDITNEMIKYGGEKLYSEIVWLRNMVSYIKAKGIWKQDPEANIWIQEGWEWGVEKAPQ